MGRIRNAYVLLGKSERKRSHEGPGRTWKDIIKKDTKEINTLFWVVTPCEPVNVSEKHTVSIFRPKETTFALRPSNLTQKQVVRVWTGFIWLRLRSSGGRGGSSDSSVCT
jgi:hypothetical protein